VKQLLTLVCVSCLIGAALYPLLLGVGRRLDWLVETALLTAGGGTLYLLVRYRRSW
jgi:hypothetical protein